MQTISDNPHDQCAVVGICSSNSDAARLAFFSLHTLQHRGQEAAGIATTTNGVAHIHKGLGLVASVFNEENLATLPGNLAIGHNRYSTTGSSGLRNAQPQLIETLQGPLGIAHNGNLVNAPQLRRSLLEKGVGLVTSSDTEVMLHLLSTATGDWQERLRNLMSQVEGAYALTILTRNAVFGVRDPWGFRPLVIGGIEGGYVLASESCAFSAIGASFVREVAPGEIVRVSATGVESSVVASDKERALCTFEQIYFSRPDSVCDGKLVHSTRQRLGRELASEAPVEADLVVAVPDSGTPHAVGFAQQSGIPYTEGLIKNRYVGRTFIEPTPQLRAARVAMKFNPLADNLVNKRVVLVDDSIVRGTTSGPLVGMLRDAGATEVHVRVACPAIVSPCFMGVDMACESELIAAHRSVEEIQSHIGADSLAYLSIEAMMRALGADDGYCNACFTGHYPFESVYFKQLTFNHKTEFTSVWND